jgi:hypothetical protein
MTQATEAHTDQRAPTQQEQNRQYYLRVLHEVIDIGTDLVRLVRQHGQVQAEDTGHVAHPRHETTGNFQKIGPSPAGASDLTDQYDTITRSLRRSILLADKLNEPVKPPPAPDPEQRTAARKHIIRAVEDTIQRRVKARDEAERLHAEFLDRLDDPDLDDDIESRPVADIIADICRDLGISSFFDKNPGKRRTPADIAILAARAAASSPSKARTPGPPPSSDSEVVVAIRPGQPTVAGKSTDPP